MGHDLTQKLGRMWLWRRSGWNTSSRSAELVLVSYFSLHAYLCVVHAGVHVTAQPTQNVSSSQDCGNGLVNATTPGRCLLNGTQLRSKQSVIKDSSSSGPTSSSPTPGPAPGKSKSHKKLKLYVLLPIALFAGVCLAIFTITLYCFYKKRYIDAPHGKQMDGVSLDTGPEKSIFSFVDAKADLSTSPQLATGPNCLRDQKPKLWELRETFSSFEKLRRGSEPLGGSVRGSTSSSMAYRDTSTETVSLKGADVRRATRNFMNKIGEGGFGPVYFGLLPGKLEVAVKVQSKDSTQGAREFATEVEVLSRAKHPNLVSLIGYSETNGGYMLVYEFLRGGTLQDRLYGDRCHPHLDWRARLKIAVQAARAISYLHNNCDPSIIHRDVKSNNILLTVTGDAKVTDFGLSKFLVGNANQISRCSVKGTSGYVDPEYYQTMTLTQKSDVYSFGIVLLETITGREPIDTSLPREQWRLTDWSRKHLSEGDLETVVDRVLEGRYNLQAMWMMADLAMTCVEPRAIDRPPMSQVVLELEFAIQEEAGIEGGFPLTP